MKFLFDLGGVFFDWNPKYFYNNIFNSKDDLDYFLNNVCTLEWNYKQDIGRSIKEAEEELILKYPNYTKEIKLYYPNHRKMIVKVFQESVDLLSKLYKKNYLCYVLSNWSAETFEGMTRDYPFLKKFDGLLISGEEKITKPNKEIFELAINRFKLIPDNTVFIDDNLDNINVAKEFKFRTIHLVDPSLINNEINKHLKYSR